MNIYDISEKAGVSIATVSRVLNGSGNVSDKTRDKVLSVIEETGYTPNIFARGLGLNTMNTIGILCADSSDSFLANAIYFLERELRRHDYDSILCCTGYDQEIKEKYLNLLLSKRVDAIILAGSSYIEKNTKQNKYLLDAAKSAPLIIVNGYLQGDNIYCSLCDDTQAICQLTTKLLESGRKSPCYLYRSLSYSGRQKLNGYLKACKDFGIADARNICHNSDILSTRDFLLSDRTFEEHDAFITSDDDMAISVLKYEQSLGRRIPEDVCITGYNNSKMGICCEPELTTLDNRLEFSCINAVSMLMQVLSGKKVPSKAIITGEIVERGTTDIRF